MRVMNGLNGHWSFPPAARGREYRSRKLDLAWHLDLREFGLHEHLCCFHRLCIPGPAREEVVGRRRAQGVRDMRPTMRVSFACFFVISILTMGAGSVIAEHALSCTTDKHIYSPGQLVQIECTNSGNHFVVTGITFLVTTADGGLVYNPAVPAIAVAVPPGESVEHTWDQKFINSPLGVDGEQVPLGRYVVTVQNGGPARFRIGAWRHHRTFETISQGSISGAMTGRGGENLVIRDQASWEAFWEEHTSNMLCPQPPCPGMLPPVIDFDQEMVLVALHGFAPTGGYGISFTWLFGGSHRLSARILNTNPGEGCVLRQVITNPFHIIATQISDDVMFHERSKTIDCN